MLATTAVADTIRDATRNFGKLFASRDVFGLAQLYCADAMLLPPGAALVTGRDRIQAFWISALDNALGGVTDLGLEPLDVQAAGDLAVEVGQYTLRLESGETAGDGKYMVVWKRDQDTWKILRDTWNANQ